MASNDSYVLIRLRHDFDLVKEDQDGNLVPISPYILPDGAYMYRGMIGEIHFPETTVIGKNCFKMCSMLDTADIRNVIDIGDSAFQDCVLLEELATPKLKTIGNASFQGCTKLKSINTDSTSSIGYSAFQDCVSLEELKIPRVKQIGDNCFRGCRNLKTLTAPNLTRIGRASFYDCDGLEDVCFPNVTRIGVDTSNLDITEGVFEKCSNLKSVILPMLNMIGENTFNGCTSVTYISLPNISAGGIPENAFGQCIELKWITLSGEIPENLMQNYMVALGIHGGCGVTCLDGTPFYGEGMTAEDFKSPDLTYQEVTVASGVTGNYIRGVQSGSVISGELFEAFGQGVYSSVFSGKTQLESVILPGVIYGIQANAFKNCTKLKKVALPGMKLDYDIESTAFTGCTALSCVEVTNATRTTVSQRLSNKSNWGIPGPCKVVCKDGVVDIGA